ncbi:hypothetical protein MesoLj131c_63500 [Mesorhizobium sp. 131-3-5]|uniref:hypothetical protein n=1 Tax=Mesorhizobium sp. 131-3-5 TaxID=2744520 RepID=UPI0019266E77|nr:hypothetical protein [Mesorhizobium sp. 131-3-5]BCH12092.1 hypothetical protein MesoLj131c_63500 [Mesorhizobium sp. 131-3-5]
MLKVDVANEVTAKSLQYVIDHAPGRLVTWMGGVSSIEEKIIARLSVEPASAVAAASTLVVVPPPAEPAPAPAAAA